MSVAAAPPPVKPAKPPKPPLTSSGNAGAYARIQKLLASGHLSAGQLQSLMALVAGGGTTPLGGIAGAAQAEVDPIIQALIGEATHTTANADAAIKGLTDSYAKELSGVDYGAPYQSGEAQQAAVDAALQGSLTGQGSDLSAQLAQKLAALQGSSGANALNQETSALASQGRNAGNIQLASGSAALGQLVGDAAAANEYGQKMPGVVKLAGLQGLSQEAAQEQSAIDQGVLQAESQVPTIEQQLKANRLEKQSIASTNAYHQAEIAAKAQSLASTNAYHQAEIGLRQQTLSSENAYRQAELSLREQGLKQSFMRIGIEDKRLQLEVTKQELSARYGGLTPSEVSRYTSVADSWAQRTIGTYTDPTTGKVEQPMSFKDAMTQALKEGVPLSIAFPQFVKTYKPNPAELAQLKKYYGPLDKALQKATNSNSFGKGVLGATFNVGNKGAKAAFTPEGARNTAYNMAAQYGWGQPAQLKALDQLWSRESGWSYTAKNPKSGALGIPQALGHKLPADFASNPMAQIKWGLDYIRGRYGSPIGAWAHEMKYGWY